jgi:hypothetical protein
VNATHVILHELMNELMNVSKFWPRSLRKVGTTDFLNSLPNPVSSSSKSSGDDRNVDNNSELFSAVIFTILFK